MKLRGFPRNGFVTDVLLSGARFNDNQYFTMGSTGGCLVKPTRTSTRYFGCTMQPI